jgi:predicted permease
MIARLFATLRGLLGRRRIEGEIAEELRDHLEREIEAYRSRGVSYEEARRLALRDLGGLMQTIESTRAVRATWLDTVWRDVGYGARVLRRSPIFTTIAVLSLALGIGANAAIFQLVDAVRLRNLPVPNAHDLVDVRPSGAQAFGTYEGVNAKATYPLWEQIRTHQTAFSGMFAWGDIGLLIGRGAAARRADGIWVSGDFFRVLGVTAARGRLIEAGDDYRGCAGGTAVISYAFWQRHFGGADTAVGSTLTIADRPVTVIGVTDASFTGLEVGRSFEIALPVCTAGTGPRRDEDVVTALDRRDFWWLTVMGRLKPGWTIERASEQMRAISPGILQATQPSGYPAELMQAYRNITFSASPAAQGVSRLRDAHDRSLLLLLGLTGLVLLITCGNVATLMLARAGAREREMAVRAAIGASRPRIVAQLVVESLLVAGAGAVLAVPMALASARALVGFLDVADNPVTLTLGVDWRLVTFVGVIAVLTTVLFGLLPALRVSVVHPIVAMRQASRGLTADRRNAIFQRALVVGQIAVSLVLVMAALLFVRTFRNLATVDFGFEPSGLFAITFMDLPSQALPVEQRVVFQRQLTEEMRSIPGIAAAASSSKIPMQRGVWSHFFTVPGGDASQKAARFTYVGPGYFETMGIRRLAGRAFTDSDNPTGRPVLIVNESFVRAHLGQRNPIGATVRRLTEPGYPETMFEIVGVVSNIKYADFRDESCWCEGPDGMPPIAYVPIAQDPSPFPWAPIVVRTDVLIAALTDAVTTRVERLNPAIAVGIIDIDEQLQDRLGPERMVAWLAGAFGVLAVVLVTVGLYGVIAYRAVSRRNEIGIRLSLGATRTQIVQLVLRDSVPLLAIGLAIGLPLTSAALRGAEALLFGLSPTDVPMLVAAAVLLAVAAAAAGSIPACRAARTQPDVALRSE